MLQKSLTGEEIAREVISTLSVEYHVSPTSLLACIRDSAATNDVPLRTLKVLVLYSMIDFVLQCDDIGSPATLSKLKGFSQILATVAIRRISR